MKEYTKMTTTEIYEIVNRGGDDLRKLNKEVVKHLDSLNLSERALDIIHSTDIAAMAECFGGLFTAEDVERFIAEEYPDED